MCAIDLTRDDKHAGGKHLFPSQTKTFLPSLPQFLGSYLLSAGELELGSSERLNGVVLVHVLAADTDHHLPDLDTRHLACGLTEGVTHTLLLKRGGGMEGGRV